MGKKVTTKQLRSFGLIVGGAFSIIGIWPVLFHREDPRWWALAIAGLLVLQAVFLPKSLGRIYLGWMIIGGALGWFNTRVILAIGFYGMFTPIGLALRLMGKDPMRRRFRPEESSYRINRSPRPVSHMEKQF